MPSSLFADMERSGNGGQGDALDDQRALQIALDQLSLLGLDNDENSLYDNEPRRKSVNMTECVPVPSSEHVAEIVGRQGNHYHHLELNVCMRLCRIPLCYGDMWSFACMIYIGNVGYSLFSTALPSLCPTKQKQGSSDTTQTTFNMSSPLYTTFLYI